MTKIETKIRALADECAQEGTEEGLIAGACLASLAGALCEGGDAMWAFSDFCDEYSKNAIARLAALTHTFSEFKEPK